MNKFNNLCSMDTDQLEESLAEHESGGLVEQGQV